MIIIKKSSNNFTESGLKISYHVYPSCGYLLEVNEKTATKLGITLDYLKKIDSEATGDLLESLVCVLEEDPNIKITINGKEKLIECVYIDDQTYGELEEGWYFYFEPQDLFTMETTDFAKTLKLKGIMPKLEAWAACN
jgi:hypothetical protein